MCLWNVFCVRNGTSGPLSVARIVICWERSAGKIWTIVSATAPRKYIQCLILYLVFCILLPGNPPNFLFCKAKPCKTFFPQFNWPLLQRPKVSWNKLSYQLSGSSMRPNKSFYQQQDFSAANFIKESKIILSENDKILTLYFNWELIKRLNRPCCRRPIWKIKEWEDILRFFKVSTFQKIKGKTSKYHEQQLQRCKTRKQEDISCASSRSAHSWILPSNGSINSLANCLPSPFFSPLQMTALDNFWVERGSS